MRFNSPFLMELSPLSKEFQLENVLSTRSASVFLGSTREKKTETLLVRSAAFQQLGFDTFEKAVIELLVESFELIERALLDAKLDQKKTGCSVFVHVVPPIENCTERDLKF